MTRTVKNSLTWFRLDYVMVIFLIVWGFFFLIEAWKLCVAVKSPDPLGTGGWPLLMSAVWVASALGILVLEIVKRGHPVASYTMTYTGIFRWLSLVVLSLLYIFIVRTGGFILTTIIFQFVLMISFGSTSKRHLVLGAVIAVIATLVIKYSYTLVFKIPLPGQL